MPRPSLGTSLVLVACLAACQRPAPEPQSQPAPAAHDKVITPKPARIAAKPQKPSEAGQSAEFSAELAELDNRLAAVLRRAESAPKGWLVLDQAANLYLTRA